MYKEKAEQKGSHLIIPRFMHVSVQDFSPAAQTKSSSEHIVLQLSIFSYMLHLLATRLHSSQKPNTS